MQCDYLVPRGPPGIWLKEGDVGECLLPDGHQGMHLVKGFDSYYLWEPDQDCYFSAECDCDYAECYVYSHISEGEAILKMQSQTPAR
jgi:hypothetical protein